MHFDLYEISLPLDKWLRKIMNKFWNGFRRKEAAIRKVALYSLILNISLVFAKLFLSAATGSLAACRCYALFG